MCTLNGNRRVNPANRTSVIEEDLRSRLFPYFWIRTRHGAVARTKIRQAIIDRSTARHWYARIGNIRRNLRLVLTPDPLPA